MNTIILHSILAFLTVAGAVITYLKWRKSKFKNETIKGLFWFFVFFTGYHLFLVLPYLLFNKNFLLMAWGYNFAILSLFLLLASIWKVVFIVMALPAKKIKFIIGMLLTLGAITLLIQIIDFHSPIVDESGFIFWNVNKLAGGLTSFFTGVIQIIWAMHLLKNWPKNLGFIEKLKSFTFSAGSLMFTVSCIYFIASKLSHIYIAFIFIFLGTFLFLFTFLLPKAKIQ